jgi:hypothetical protein
MKNIFKNLLTCDEPYGDNRVKSGKYKKGPEA